MLETSSCTVKNQYSRSVRPMGNPHSLKVIEEVFETAESNWRGIGIIPNSGLKLRKKYAEFDAEKVFDTGKLNMGKTNSEKICPEKINTKEMNLEKIKSKEKSAGEATVCIAGEILMGLKKPIECNCFGKECTPISPIGAPMVSSEGACAAYYKYSKRITRE